MLHHFYLPVIPVSKLSWLMLSIVTVLLPVNLSAEINRVRLLRDCLARIRERILDTIFRVTDNKVTLERSQERIK